METKLTITNFINCKTEAVKFLENFFKKSFPRTKKEIFCKRKKDFFHKKNFFTRHNLFMCIYIHYSYVHFVYFQLITLVR